MYWPFAASPAPAQIRVQPDHGAVAIARSARPRTRSAAIGVATMLADGTLVLDLRASGEGMVGDARITYKRDDPHYQEVSRRIGPMRPGEQRPVYPFD